MAGSRSAKVSKAKRAKLLQELWPSEQVWEGPDERGFFCAPRTLPLILCALKQKNISKNLDPTSVYLELYSRNMGEGIIEMLHDEEHAYASGYFEARAIRSWRDRMKVLEDFGFIKSKQKGNRRYGFVILTHPSIVMAGLYDQGEISEELWVAYKSRQIECKEYTREDLVDSEEHLEDKQ